MSVDTDSDRDGRGSGGAYVDSLGRTTPLLHVRRHPHLSVPCPTVHTSFSEEIRGRTRTATMVEGPRDPEASRAGAPETRLHRGPSTSSTGGGGRSRDGWTLPPLQKTWYGCGHRALIYQSHPHFLTSRGQETHPTSGVGDGQCTESYTVGSGR